MAAQCQVALDVHLAGGGGTGGPALITASLPLTLPDTCVVSVSSCQVFHRQGARANLHTRAYDMHRTLQFAQSRNAEALHIAGAAHNRSCTPQMLPQSTAASVPSLNSHLYTTTLNPELYTTSQPPTPTLFPQSSAGA